MPSPFPGVDPFIEDQGNWRDFHVTFISTFRDALNEILPDHYHAAIDERVGFIDVQEVDRTAYPDVAVVREGAGPSRGVGATMTAAEPVMVPLAILDEEREAFIEVYRLPERELVAVVEVLSPSNKVAPGRQTYLTKRNSILHLASVHLVEIDLLCGGRRAPMLRPLPRGDCYVFVARGEERPDCRVYAWSIRDPLPTIRFPLADPDADVLIDLAQVYATTTRRGRYDRTINYAAPLEAALAAEDRAWAEELARSAFAR